MYSDADKEALHVKQADEAYRLGPALASQSYLRGDIILDIAKQCGAQVCLLEARPLGVPRSQFDGVMCEWGGACGAWCMMCAGHPPWLRLPV